MAYFKWVGQKNWLDPTITDKVIEFRANLREPGYSSHFPIDPVNGFQPGEALRGPGVTDPNDKTPFDFADAEYRLRQMAVDVRIAKYVPTL